MGFQNRITCNCDGEVFDGANRRLTFDSSGITEVITMEKHWRKLAFSGLLLIILIFAGARNDSFQQTQQAQNLETRGRCATSVMPQQWGALGDGVHNDAGAIQAAIDSGVTEIFLPNLNPNAKNPVKVPSTNYYLGTTSLTITKPIRFRMATGTSLVYTGKDAAVKVDCSAALINGAQLDFYDIYSSGAYAVKITGTAGDPNSHYLLHSRITGHEFWCYTFAGIYCDTLMSESVLDVQAFYPNYPSPLPHDGWGFYFTQGCAGVRWECNRLYTNSIYGSQGAYLPQYFQYGYVNIAADSINEDLTPNKFKIVVGGIYNHIVITAATPIGVNYPQGYPLLLQAGAFGNVIAASSGMLKGIADDNPLGDNYYGGADGQENYLLNSSFESFNNDPEAIDWYRANVTVSRETNTFKHGKSGVKITSYHSGGYANISQSIPNALIGKIVTFAGWFMAPSTNTKKAAIAFAGLYNAVIPNDDHWHFLSITGTVPNPANYVYIYANITNSAAAGEIVYADGCTLTVGNVPTFPGRNAGHKIYSKATWGPGNIRDGAMTSTTVSLIGAVIGDPVSLGFSQAVPAGAILSGSVTATDTVTVTLLNKTGGHLDLKPGTLRVLVRKNE